LKSKYFEPVFAIDQVAASLLTIMAEDENVEAQVAIMKENLDSFFLIVMGIVVFLMQCGFAFLEAGAVRSKNTVNILIKNMLDCLIGGVAYWAIGWGVAYGEDGNGFLGTKQFFSINMDHSKYPLWFFQYVFAATAATIVSGSIAERCNFNAYFVYSIFITGLKFSNKIYTTLQTRLF
jgi:Amt family ammonium transporter